MTISSISMSGNLQSSLSPLFGGSSFGVGSLEGLFASLLSGAGVAENSEFSMGDLLSSLADGAEGGDVDGFLSALLGGLNEISNEGLDIDFSAFLSGEEGGTSLAASLNAGDQNADLLSMSSKQLLAEIKSALGALSAKIAGRSETGIASVDDLAAAYEELGMSPEEAQEKAIRTATAIDVLRSKVENVAEKSEGNTDVLAAIFESLTDAQKSGLVDFVHQDTQIRLHHISKSLQLSESLSSNDIAFKVRSGEALSNGMMAKTALSSLVSKVNALGGTDILSDVSDVSDVAIDELMGAKSTDVEITDGAVIKNTKAQNALLALKELGEKQKSTSSVPDGLNRVLRQLTSTNESVKAPTLFESLEAEVAKAENLGLQTITDKAGVGAFSDAATVEPQEMSRYMARREGKEEGLGVSRSTEKTLFSIKPSDKGGLNVEDFSVEVLTSQESVDNAETFEGDVLEQGIDLQTTRIENRAKIETTTPLERLARQADIASQVNVKVRSLAANGGGSVKLMINPPELGEMEIRLEISNRTVKGQIIVQTQEVADQLARDLRVLQQGLADAGLNLGEEGFTFILQQDAREQLAEGDEGQDGNRSSGQGANQGDEGEVDMAVNTATHTPWRNVDKILDMNI